MSEQGENLTGLARMDAPVPKPDYSKQLLEAAIQLHNCLSKEGDLVVNFHTAAAFIEFRNVLEQIKGED